MAALYRPPSIFTTRISLPKVRNLGSWNIHRPLQGLNTFPQIRLKHPPPILCTKFPPWESSPVDEPSPVAFASKDDDNGNSFLMETANIFESVDAKKEVVETLISDKQDDVTETKEVVETFLNKKEVDAKKEMETANIFESVDAKKEVVETLISDKQDDVTETKDQISMQAQPLKWPLWLLGPSILLVTGMVPTLWLPLSSVFVGANTASLLSLIGLDCLFNIGVTLFLLMADFCARPKSPQTCKSRAPLSYRFWNTVASVMGFAIPLVMLFASSKGVFLPQMSFISFAVLLGPYLLLLSIQMLTESLTWYWESPVWLVTPVVYEAYRVLQLLRGLKLAVEIGAPLWIMESIRVLVSWWVLILGIQLMRVAWIAGFAERSRQQA